MNSCRHTGECTILGWHLALHQLVVNLHADVNLLHRMCVVERSVHVATEVCSMQAEHSTSWLSAAQSGTAQHDAAQCSTAGLASAAQLLQRVPCTDKSAQTTSVCRM
jgi:hypothetical protein